MSKKVTELTMLEMSIKSEQKKISKEQKKIEDAMKKIQESEDSLATMFSKLKEIVIAEKVVKFNNDMADLKKYGISLDEVISKSDYKDEIALSSAKTDEISAKQEEIVTTIIETETTREEVKNEVSKTIVEEPKHKKKKERTKALCPFVKRDIENEVYTFEDQYSIGIYNGVPFEVAHGFDGLAIYGCQHQMYDEIMEFVKGVIPTLDMHKREKKGVSYNDPKHGRIHQIGDGVFEGYVVLNRWRAGRQEICFVYNKIHGGDKIAVMPFDERYDAIKKGEEVEYHASNDKYIREIVEYLLKCLSKVCDEQQVTKEVAVAATEENVVITESTDTTKASPIKDVISAHKKSHGRKIEDAASKLQKIMENAYGSQPITKSSKPITKSSKPITLIPVVTTNNSDATITDEKAKSMEAMIRW